VPRADNLTTFLCRLSRNSGASTSWNPKGLSRPVAGKLYLYVYIRTPSRLSICWFLQETGFNSSLQRAALWNDSITPNHEIRHHRFNRCFKMFSFCNRNGVKVPGTFRIRAVCRKTCICIIYKTSFPTSKRTQAMSIINIRQSMAFRKSLLVLRAIRDSQYILWAEAVCADLPAGHSSVLQMAKIQDICVTVTWQPRV
jgi:hypothetical protein